MKSFILRKRNIGIVIILIFVIWMLFFDANSYIYQLNYNKEIKKLEDNVEFYEKEIQQNKEIINNLSKQHNIDQFAREQYYYKKENEQIYLIEYDTLD